MEKGLKTLSPLFTMKSFWSLYLNDYFELINQVIDMLDFYLFISDFSVNFYYFVVI